jgi:hypothetical protein
MMGIHHSPREKLQNWITEVREAPLDWQGVKATFPAFREQ